MKILEVKNLVKSFGKTEVLKGIDFSLEKGEVLSIIGSSGSGKTTLMNMIGALDMPTSGKVFVDGADICSLSEKERENLRRTKIGYVFQSVSLIPTMNAFQNVEFSLRLAGVKGSRKERVEECLKLVGLGKRMNHMPAELSGGEQQRVAIARALAHKPEILLADEPTAELDSAMAAEVTRLFQEMSAKEGVTIIMTTHDMGLMDAGDMVIELENGQQIDTDGQQGNEV